MFKKYTNEKIRSIQLNQSNEYKIKLKTDENIWIIIPTYFWALPKLIEEYLNKIEIERENPNPYINVISTYGTTPGSSIKIFKYGNIIIKSQKLFPVTNDFNS